MGNFFSKRGTHSRRRARTFDNFRDRMNAQAVAEPFCPEVETECEGFANLGHESPLTAMFSMLSQSPVPPTTRNQLTFQPDSVIFRTPQSETQYQVGHEFRDFEQHSDEDFSDLLPIDFDMDMFNTNESEESSDSSFRWGLSVSSIDSDALFQAELSDSDSTTSEEDVEIAQTQQLELSYNESKETPGCSSSQSSKECDICLDKKKNTAFNPCGHGACGKCAVQLRVCHICRKPIQSKLKLYL